MSNENNSQGLISKEAKDRAANYMALKNTVVQRAIRQACPICDKSMRLCKCSESDFFNKDLK